MYGDMTMTPKLTETRPWWIETVYKLGVPTVIAGALLWFFMTQVSANIANIQRDLREHVAATNFYLRAICMNGSKDEAERANCVAPPHVDNGR